MRRYVVAFGLAILGAAALMASAGWAQPETKPEPPKPAAPATPAPAAPAPPKQQGGFLGNPFSIDKLAFMTGAWSEKFGEGRNEEHWSGAAGGSMMGMFRMMREDGSVVVYELLAISAEQDGTYLRLRHFDPKLTPREGRDDTIVLRLESVEGTRATFRKEAGSKSLDAIIYEGVGKDRLKGEVRFTKESGRNPILIDMKRQALD